MYIFIFMVAMFGHFRGPEIGNPKKALRRISLFVFIKFAFFTTSTHFSFFFTALTYFSFFQMENIQKKKRNASKWSASRGNASKGVFCKKFHQFLGEMRRRAHFGLISLPISRAQKCPESTFICYHKNENRHIEGLLVRFVFT